MKTVKNQRRVASILFLIAALCFFLVAATVPSNRRSVNIALGSAFMILAAGAARKSRE